MEPEFVFTVMGTGERLNLSREDENLLIAIILNLFRDATVLDAEVVLEDVLDADEIG